MPHRALIKGGSGSGKSTLAAALAARLDLPHIELDALHHGPNWTSASAAELRASIEAALDDTRGWVVDGNYDSKLGTLILDRADVILWLDLPLHTKLVRLAIRSARRAASREPLWNGNRETFAGLFLESDALFPWAVRSHFKQRATLPAFLRDRNVIRLRSPQAIRAFLSTVKKNGSL